jgi:D-glycero-D-manno-heptose 1,7-bisphosphate phosphatase
MSLVILDRDGVINEDSDNYIRSVDDWQSIPGSIEAIAQLSRAGFTVAIATNQSGLGRGYFEPTVLESIHRKLRQLVEDAGGRIAGIFYCPHLPQDECACRKPATGLIKAIEQELELSAVGAPFIGDSLKDLQAARAHGCMPNLVKTGKGQKTLATLQGAQPGVTDPETIPVYADLADATHHILSAKEA